MKLLNIFLFWISGWWGGSMAVFKFKNRKKKIGLIEKQRREKEQDKRAILGILETQTPLTNNHIEQLLGISDATATRYLEELEKRISATGGQDWFGRVL